MTDPGREYQRASRSSSSRAAPARPGGRGNSAASTAKSTCSLNGVPGDAPASYILEADERNKFISFFLSTFAPQYERAKSVDDPWITNLRRLNYGLIWIGLLLIAIPDVNPIVQHVFICVVTLESIVRLGVKRKIDVLYILDAVPCFLYFITWAIDEELLPDMFCAIVMRSLRFLKYSILYPAIKKSFSRCNAVAWLILTVISFLAILMYFAEVGEWDDTAQRLVLNVGQDAQVTKLNSVPQTLWWAFVTATTVGYGDLVPVTWLGRLVAIITIWVGIVMVAVPGILVGRRFIHLYKRQHAEKVTAIAENICRRTPEVIQKRSAPHLLHHIRDLGRAIEQHKFALQMVEEALNEQPEWPGVMTRVQTGRGRIRKEVQRKLHRIRTW